MKSMSLVDAHIHHADNEFSLYIDSIIATFKAMRIKVCSVCVDNQTSLRSIRLLNNLVHRDTIFQLSEFIHYMPVMKMFLDSLLLETNVKFIDGIGEIGLDRDYTLNDYSPYPKQKEVFELMLRLAESHHKPISVQFSEISRRGIATDELHMISPAFSYIGFSGNKEQLRKVSGQRLLCLVWSLQCFTPRTKEFA